MNSKNPHSFNTKELVFPPSSTNMKVKLAMITKLTPPSELVLLCQNYSIELESTLTHVRRLLKSAKQLSALTTEDIGTGLSDDLAKKCHDLGPQDLILVSYSVIHKMAPAHMVGYRALLGKKAAVIQELMKKDYSALVRLIITKVVTSTSINFSSFLEGLMLIATMIEDWQPTRKRGKQDDWNGNGSNAAGNQTQGGYGGGSNQNQSGGNGQSYSGWGNGNKRRRMGTGYIYGYMGNYGTPTGFQSEQYGIGGPNYMGNNGGAWSREYDRWMNHWNNTNPQQVSQQQQQQGQPQQQQQQQGWNTGGGQSQQQQQQQNQGKRPSIAQRLVKAYANLASCVESLNEQDKEAYFTKYNKLHSYNIKC